MNVRPGRREEPEIILIPLIDILLMLLIFFMLATTFRHAAEIAINLPEAAPRKVPEIESKSLDVAIDRQGRFFIDRQAVVNSDLETVKSAMRQAAGARKELVVMISADAHTPHHLVIKAMDAAQQLGLFKISIATQQLNIPAS